MLHGSLVRSTKMLSDIGPEIKLKSLQKNKASNFKRERGSETQQPFYFETEKKEGFFSENKWNEILHFYSIQKIGKGILFFFCWFFRSIFCEDKNDRALSHFSLQTLML